MLTRLAMTLARFCHIDMDFSKLLAWSISLGYLPI